MGRCDKHIVASRYQVYALRTLREPLSRKVTHMVMRYASVVRF